MRIEATLATMDPRDAPLRFAWDSEKGELYGPDADRLAELVSFYVSMGEARIPAPGSPFDWAVPISDPLHVPRDMAAVLMSRWQLPAELLPFAPELGPPPTDGMGGVENA